jgi:hypothetical protein
MVGIRGFSTLSSMGPQHLAKVKAPYRLVTRPVFGMEISTIRVGLLGKALFK